MSFQVESEQEEDGRWLAEIPQLSGVMAYGAAREDAITRAKILALRVVADRLNHGEQIPNLSSVFMQVAQPAVLD